MAMFLQQLGSRHLHKFITEPSEGAVVSQSVAGQ